MDPADLARYVGINGPGGHLGVAVQVGGHDSELNRTVRDRLVPTATKLRSVAHEIRTSDRLLPSDQARRVVEASQPLVAEMKRAAGVYAAESQRVGELAASSWVKPYSAATPLHVVLTDQQLAARFERLDPSARKIVVARITAEPATPEHLRMAEMLLRQDRAVTQISAEDHSTLRQAILAQFDPTLAASIETQQEQVAQLRKALQLCMQVLAESGAAGVSTGLRTTSPDLAEALQEPDQ